MQVCSLCIATRHRLAQQGRQPATLVNRTTQLDTHTGGIREGRRIEVAPCTYVGFQRNSWPHGRPRPLYVDFGRRDLELSLQHLRVRAYRNRFGLIKRAGSLGKTARCHQISRPLTNSCRIKLFAGFKVPLSCRQLRARSGQTSFRQCHIGPRYFANFKPVLRSLKFPLQKSQVVLAQFYKLIISHNVHKGLHCVEQHSLLHRHQPLACRQHALFGRFYSQFGVAIVKQQQIRGNANIGIRGPTH
mmetsp:Transcript_27028/g.49106  ORF Transcript_27028/g.49106 Transcript_27028/m.49106 type:complete len:245 (+) Transcript_27028:3912-4646(+)